MARHKFDDNCQDCRPVLINPATGTVMADDSPEMQRINRIWNRQSLATKEAYHRCTCLNSRAPADLFLVHLFLQEFEKDDAN